MKNIFLSLFALCSLTIGSNALAESYLCSSASIERSIDVVYATEGYPTPCEVQYSKNGETNTLWSAENEAGYCEAKAKELADKLAQAGWSCRVTNP